jgi:hypothetical protein
LWITSPKKGTMSCTNPTEHYKNMTSRLAETLTNCKNSIISVKYVPFETVFRFQTRIQLASWIRTRIRRGEPDPRGVNTAKIEREKKLPKDCKSIKLSYPSVPV